MSYRASEKRVRDSHLPVGLRVMCLHECLERFNLFGFTATRDRLRLMTGATAPGWSEESLLAAIRHLSAAREDWLRYRALAVEARRADKAAGARTSSRRPVEWTWFNDWLEGYLTGSMAACWLVVDLGSCHGCSHLLIHHGKFACAVCTASYAVDWDDRCQAKLPALSS